MGGESGAALTGFFPLFVETFPGQARRSLPIAHGTLSANVETFPGGADITRNRSRGAVTIRDVASRAGVAVSTVSRVLSGGYSSEDARNRVQEAITALNYRPNRMAQGLVRKESRTFGLVVPDISNPFFPALTRGVEDKARAMGYAVLLANTDDNEGREEIAIRTFLEKQVDGLIVASVGKSASRLLATVQTELPLVVMDRRVSTLDVHSVKLDNVAGAIMAVQHLLALGHRRIAYIGGTPGIFPDTDRMNGYLTALQAAGLPIDRTIIRHGAFKYEGGATAMRELLSRGCTAVFAANDLMALGAIKTVSEVGLRVPGDMSVIGFDDIPMSELAFPSLTTIRQPTYEMGVKAAELLLQARMGLLPDGVQQITFEPELIRRGSTGSRNPENQ